MPCKLLNSGVVSHKALLWQSEDLFKIYRHLGPTPRGSDLIGLNIRILKIEIIQVAFVLNSFLSYRHLES